jgi:RNA polymerase sigma-70 factor (ECF subfamily)
MTADADLPDFQRAVAAAYPRLLRRAERLTMNNADACDLVHDTMVRALQRRDRFRVGSSADRWLSTILRRLFVDGYRHDRVADRIVRQLYSGAARLAFDLDAADDRPPAPALWKLFAAEDVHRLLPRLPHHLREPYIMFSFEQLSHREIAGRTGSKSATVATRISRARDRLAGWLVAGRMHPSALLPAGRAVRKAAAAPAKDRVRVKRAARIQQWATNRAA